VKLWKLFHRERRRRDPWDHGAPLLEFAKHVPWTNRHAMNGTLIVGASGSGKTSGSGRAIANAFLQSGYGGIVLCGKSDETTNWCRLCEDSQRTGDLILFGKTQPWRFNFLDDELTRSGEGAGLTENIVALLMTILEVADKSGGGKASASDAYWRNAAKQLIRNAVDAISLSKQRLSVPALYRMVSSAPISLEQVKSQEWKSRSFCYHSLLEAERLPRTASQNADFALVLDYFTVEFPSLSDKTRSVIVSTFTSTIDVLQRGILRDLFCAESNITPRAVEEGKIIVIDLPVKEFGQVGLFAQILWKYCLQRTIERRTFGNGMRPVFVWMDEAQTFLTSNDMEFQATCRSAGVATVMLTQNVSNFYAALGGSEKAEAETASLFSNLSTKIFHANSDHGTNDFASNVIGQSLQQFANANTSTSGASGLWGLLDGMNGEQTSSTTAGYSESYNFEVQPSEFTRLRTGGEENDGLIDAIVVQNGRTFDSGRTWLPVTFTQKRRG